MRNRTIISLCLLFCAVLAGSGIFTPAAAQISSFSQPAETRTEFYSNGDQYTGEFANGKYNGNGTYIWANGDRYEGEFANGQIEGVGCLTFKNGESWNGYFIAGQITNGSGTFYYGNDGATFTGPWQNGQPNGPGILRYANGTTQNVNIQNGVITTSQNSGAYSSQSQWGGSPMVYNPFQGIRAGGTVTFGSFDQDNNAYNGKEPIVWNVLEIRDGRALLLSQKLLEAMPYNYSQVSVTWEGSTIRSWLNGTFYNEAFSNDEKAMISKSWLSNPNSSVYGTYGGNDTFDNVFLLSMNELTYYFPYESQRKASPTVVSRAHGAYGTADVNCAWWWLRSPGQNTACATSVNSIGVLLNTGPLVNDSTGGIRPAIWVNLGY